MRSRGKDQIRTLNTVRRPLMIALGLMASSSCNDWPAQTTAGFRVLSVQLVATGLESPVLVASPPGDSRLFVVERRGVIRIVRSGQPAAEPFLDLRGEVSTFGSERGMLSMAFHPQYAQSGRFFVTYTGIDGAVHLVRFERSGNNPDVANPATRQELLRIPTPGVQHYGGMMQFTPEGKLLVSIGEGGTFTEPGGEAQNPETLLGKLLRLDVDSGDPYRVPSDNPYANRENWRGEIWAMGLRNPWRFSVDPSTRELYLADVGDNSYEEVNIVPVDTPGLNYGWNYFEGPNCQFAEFCTSGEFHLPEVEYSHQPPCTSVTGGIVYRGTAYPEHQGRYFYADYCLGWIRSLRFVGGRVTEELDWATSIPSDHIVSFGEDGANELYAVSLSGRIYRIEGERPGKH
jgi:glucose/arabinose dehydrogenase